MSGYKPKPRQSYGSFGNYHKKRASTCHYNRGLYWMDPSGGQRAWRLATSTAMPRLF